MTDTDVDEDYEKALAKLAERDPELRSWIDNAVPHRLAEAFAAAPDLILWADYHRPLRPEDGPLHHPRGRFTAPDMVFVTDKDIAGPTTILHPDGGSLIACHGNPLIWRGINATRIDRTTRERCEEELKKYRFEENEPGFVMLLCFEDINDDLIGVVQDMKGFVIVVQDKGGEANEPFVHPDNFDLRIPSEKLWDILMSLETLRYCYRYIDRS
jgi:hypothetical protein